MARVEVTILSVLPALLGLVRWGNDSIAWWPVAAVPLGAFISWRIWITPPSAAYNKLLALAGLHLLLFGILFTLGALL